MTEKNFLIDATNFVWRNSHFHLDSPEIELLKCIGVTPAAELALFYLSSHD